MLDQHCAAIGRDSTSIERSINVMFDLGRDAGSLAEQWGDMWKRVSGGSLHGEVDDVIDAILAYHDAGADLLNIALRAPVDRDLLDRFLTEIAPEIRRRTA